MSERHSLHLEHASPPSMASAARFRGRLYSIRPDGTIVLPVGERPPDFTVDEYGRLARSRLAALTG